MRNCPPQLVTRRAAEQSRCRRQLSAGVNLGKVKIFDSRSKLCLQRESFQATMLLPTTQQGYSTDDSSVSAALPPILPFATYGACRVLSTTPDSEVWVHPQPLQMLSAGAGPCRTVFCRGPRRRDPLKVSQAFGGILQLRQPCPCLLVHFRPRHPRHRRGRQEIQPELNIST